MKTANAIDWAEIRSRFPLIKQSTYLNSASRGAYSNATYKVICDYQQFLYQGSTKSVFELMETIQNSRKELAQKISVNKENVAFLGNSSMGMNIATLLFRNQGEVILYQEDFPSVTLPWQNSGYPVRFFQNKTPGVIRLEDIDSVRTPASKILVLSHVQFGNGIRINLEEVGNYCKENDLIFVVDAAQSFGVFDLDMKKQNIKILVATGYKWACAGYGIAMVYIDPELFQNKLPMAGWRSVTDPYALKSIETEYRFCAESLEAGHAPFGGVLALNQGLSLPYEIGLKTVQDRIHQLTVYLHQAAEKSGLEILSPQEKPFQSGITIIGSPNPNKVVNKLLDQNVIVSARGKGIRISIHLYNNLDDIDHLLTVLKS